MAERPDLEEMRQLLHASQKVTPYRGMGLQMQDKLRAFFAELLTYCRELEAENKRLRADIDEMSFTPEPETWRSGPG